jgi:hypothetical protein
MGEFFVAITGLNEVMIGEEVVRMFFPDDMDFFEEEVIPVVGRFLVGIGLVDCILAKEDGDL